VIVAKVFGEGLLDKLRIVGERFGDGERWEHRDITLTIGRDRELTIDRDSLISKRPGFYTITLQ